MRNAALLFTAWISILVCPGQTPEWIWHHDTNASTVYFRKAFRIPPQTWNSRLTVSADDRAEIFLNGILVARCTDWRHPSRSEVTVRLNQGENVIAVKGENGEGKPGLLAHLNVGGALNFVSDSSWLSSTNEETNWSALNFNAAHWSKVATLGQHGVQPWGDVLFRAMATHPDSIKVTEGFKVELLRSADPGEGSWICMTFDDKGRIIISPQGEQHPLLRLTTDGAKISAVEKVEAPIRYAMGLLQAFDSLYVNGLGPEGAGLHRLIDANKNDRYETNELHLLKRFRGGSEHGYHALALGPDKKIYVLNGNGTKLPEGISPKSPYRNYAEDALTGARGDELPGTKAPNCHVLRTDPEGREWELFAGGMRNAYDMDFNEDGELFAFDSDNEWDWGVPWYRPTRVVGLISGGEAGWRDGTRMWDEDYLDAVPTEYYAGIGSPTGTKFYRGTNFPEKYRGTLFVQDWSYGRIIALRGRGVERSFLSGAPLNLTSMAFGPDGTMYFITGGRGTQSGLYRVSYIGGKEPNEVAPDALRFSRTPTPPFFTKADPAGVERVQAGPNPELERRIAEEKRVAEALKQTGRRIEALHSGASSADLDLIWTNLNMTSGMRFAARVALETLPAPTWKERALAEEDPGRAFPALLALARVGTSEDQPALLERLGRWRLRTSSDPLKLQKLRIIQVSLARHGRPPQPTSDKLIAELNAEYPAFHNKLNRELSRILLFLDAPGAVSKTTTLLLQSGSAEQQLHYIELLRNVRNGWQIADRDIFFSWFQKPRNYSNNRLQRYFEDVGRTFVEGASYDGYLRDFRRQGMATLSENEKVELEHLLAKPILQARMIPTQSREFVREWTMEELLPEIGKERTADLARGRQAFVDAQCLNCHRFGNDGAMAGPELTAAASKYTDRDLLESILDPSKVINEQYQDHTVFVSDGEVVTGRLVSDSDTEVEIEVDRILGTREKVKKEKVQSLRPAALSPMPRGLANSLTKEEILDLLAYMRSGAATTR